MIAVVTFFWFLCGHALADYPLQGSFLSSAKRKGGITGFPWPIALASHGLIHGCMVALVVTGMLFAVTNITAWGILSIAFVIAMLETFCHAVIDYQKCNNKLAYGLTRYSMFGVRFVGLPCSYHHCILVDIGWFSVTDEW